MSFQQELSSWFSPSAKELGETPTLGSKAPAIGELAQYIGKGKPAVITFMRHCGCPFAEKTFLNLRTAAQRNPEIQFIAISHSNQDHTNRWLESLPPPQGGEAGASSGSPHVAAGPVKMIIDDEREIYAQYGLGTSSFLHVLSPGGLMNLVKLGREEGIWNRPTESGSRWQTAGAWAVDGSGVVRWGRPNERADDLPDYDEAVKVLDGSGSKL